MVGGWITTMHATGVGLVFFKFLVYFKFLYLFLVHHTNMDNPPIVTTHTNGNVFFLFPKLTTFLKKMVYIMLVDTQFKLITTKKYQLIIYFY